MSTMQAAPQTPYILMQSAGPGSAPIITYSNQPSLSIADSVTAWLSQQTIIAGIPNFWFLGTAIFAWFYFSRGRRY